MAETTAPAGDDKAAERMQLATSSLRGDIRDQILRVVRELPNAWQKMTGDGQQDVIDRIDTLADRLVTDTVDIIASHGCDHVFVTLGKISINDGEIDCKFRAPATHDAVTALYTRQGRSVVLIARDADNYKGERARAEPDNVGELAIPRGELQPQMPLTPPNQDGAAPTTHG